ncbi:MAG: paraquat-inducible protein A [Rhodobiaceae bacterium]|nr:paraquat-inducible protein A [Rhodobiaceae bacterium]
MTASLARAIAAALLAAALVCLIAGVRLPIIELKRFFVFEDGYSILSLIGTLTDAGEWVLATIIALFAVVFPLFKIAALALMLTPAVSPVRRARLSALIDGMGKWSMLDVLIAAVIIVTVKISGLESAATQPGLYFFVASIVLTIAASRFERRSVGA